jgi:hypothetical protein
MDITDIIKNYVEVYLADSYYPDEIRFKKKATGGHNGQAVYFEHRAGNLVSIINDLLQENGLINRGEKNIAHTFITEVLLENNYERVEDSSKYSFIRYGYKENSYY